MSASATGPDAPVPPRHDAPPAVAPPPPPPPPPPHWGPPRRGRWKWIVLCLLLISLIANTVQWMLSDWQLTSAGTLVEKFHSGTNGAKQRLAVIRVDGTIMPPFTNRTIHAIQQAQKDDTVKGVLLQIDSPGGFVADSHQIYHRLKLLNEVKPVVVCMESIAASGGYYVAMGCGPKGKIFVEPTTWTGSIGVIIPRFEFVGMKEKLGFDSKPLKTGEFKDALNPFEPLSEREKQVWDNILNQSFERFLKVIDDNREGLNLEQVRKLATGEVYTADDAIKHRLVDAIGYEEDGIAELKKQANLTDSQVEVFEYHVSGGLVDLVLGARAPDPAAEFRGWLEMTVPRAMYYSSWLPGLPRWPEQ